MKKTIPTYVLLSLIYGMSLNLQAHVKFKLNPINGFEQYPTAVKKIEDYLNKHIGAQLDHNATIHLKLSLESYPETFNAYYIDRSSFEKECKQECSNTVMQDAILKNSHSNTNPHGLIFLHTEEDIEGIDQYPQESLPTFVQGYLRHVVTHGLGISSHIEDSYRCHEHANDESLRLCLRYASDFDIQLNKNELTQFCKTLTKRKCPKHWRTFDMHIVDSTGTPLINKATLHYQGIDFCSLDENQRGDLEIFFEGTSAGKVRLETSDGMQLEHVHHKFPFENSVMTDSSVDECADNAQWTDFEVSMLKDLGYNINTPGVKRIPIYSNVRQFLLSKNKYLILGVSECEPVANDLYERPRHLSTGLYGLGHLTKDSPIAITIFDQPTGERNYLLAIPLKRLSSTQTIPIWSEGKSYQLKITVQHPYQGKDAYYVEFALSKDGTVCSSGVCGHSEL